MPSAHGRSLQQLQGHSSVLAQRQRSTGPRILGQLSTKLEAPAVGQRWMEASPCKGIKQVLKHRDLKQKGTRYKREDKLRENQLRGKGVSETQLKTGLKASAPCVGALQALRAPSWLPQLFAGSGLRFSYRELISPSALNEIILSSKSWQKRSINDFSALWFTDTRRGIKLALRLLLCIVSRCKRLCTRG